MTALGVGSHAFHVEADDVGQDDVVGNASAGGQKALSATRRLGHSSRNQASPTRVVVCPKLVLGAPTSTSEHSLSVGSVGIPVVPDTVSVHVQSASLVGKSWDGRTGIRGE